MLRLRQLATPAFVLALLACERTPSPVSPAHASVACAFTTTKPDWWTPLYVSPDLPQYATVHKDREVSAVMQLGPASLGAQVAVRAKGWELHGIAPASAVILHPTRAILLADVLAPAADVRLYFTRGEPGALAVGTAIEPGLAVSDVDARVACADLTIGLAEPFDPMAAIGGFGLDKKMRLTGDGPVQLSKTAGGPAAAVMTGAELRLVHVIAEEGAYSRVVWNLYGSFLIGWVPRARLEPSANFQDNGRGTGGGYGSSASNVHACPTDVPLFVVFEPDGGARAEFPRVDETPHSVGTLRANGAFSRKATEGEHVRIDLSVAGVASIRSHFVVRAADIAACAPIR
jgi:hypothetical protein